MPDWPDAIAERDVRVAGQLQLLLGHLTDRAEQMSADLVVRVLAQEHALDLDRREPGLVLLEVEDGLEADIGLERHGAERAAP